MAQPIMLPIAESKETISILAGMANRHGLIAGATGTGKTVTLRVLAEQFSRIGVAVFSGGHQRGSFRAAAAGRGESQSGRTGEAVEIKEFHL